MIKQFIKFALIGVMNTVITILSYRMLLYFGCNYIIANTIGYILGTLNSYFFNNNWVFEVKDKSKEVFNKFVAVNIVTLCLSNFLLSIFKDKLNYEENLAQLLVIPITMMFNFILNKFWTFKRRKIK